VNTLNKTQLKEITPQIDGLRKRIGTGEIRVPDENTDLEAWAGTLR
jgi:hypothetical protein